MGISSLLLRVERALCPQRCLAEDALLDDLIREALLEEALSMPPAGTWERLRSTISEGAARRQGMWVIQEAQDHATQRAAQERQAARVERQLSMLRHGRADHWRQACDLLWGNMFPTYVALVNW